MGDLNIFNLSDFKNKFNLKCFVETGTLYGKGIDYALLHGFEKIYSIEIDHELYLQACKKYEGNSKVNLINGSSHESLKKIIDIKENCLFWLDAHFPGADCKKRSYIDEKDMDVRAPLQIEIELISKRKNDKKDVIIADDLWLYNTTYNYEFGNVDDHMKKIGQNFTRQDLIGNTNDNFFYDCFSDTHDLEVVLKHQGFMVITPKE